MKLETLGKLWRRGWTLFQFVLVDLYWPAKICVRKILTLSPDCKGRTVGRSAFHGAGGSWAISYQGPFFRISKDLKDIECTFSQSFCMRDKERLSTYLKCFYFRTIPTYNEPIKMELWNVKGFTKFIRPVKNAHRNKQRITQSIL